MKFVYSDHWSLKNQFIRSNITEYDIEYALLHSSIIRDKCWDDAFNAIWQIPPSGRKLKVVYKRLPENHIKIITAFWID